MDQWTARVVESELGSPPERIERLDGGLIHETYAVRCGGREYVLQWSESGGWEEEGLWRGLHCYLALAGAAVPVPAVVTETVRERDGRAYTLVERLPGETAEGAVSPDRAASAGRALAALHGVRTFETAGWIRHDDPDLSVGAFPAGSHSTRVRTRCEENTSDLRDGGLDAAAAAAERVTDRLGDLPEPTAPVLCHDDFSPDNLLFEGDAVTGVLDFDMAKADHRHRDLVKAATAFWMHDPRADPDVRQAVYRGYRAGEPGASFEATEPLYRVETLVEIVAGMLDRDALSAREREFYDERIRAAVERAEAT